MREILRRLDEKKRLLEQHRPFPQEFIQNMDEWFKVELTYTSNAIEGNTLTRQETALVVEKGLTIEGKSLTEHLEAVNHAKAWGLVKQWSHTQSLKITERRLLEIHNTLLHAIDDLHAGCYRTVPVRIAGSTVVMPNPVKVPILMKEFMEWLQKGTKDHIITRAADAHLKLVTIHPFTDGNGRTARLLMNLLLLQQGYPPAIIAKEERRPYLNSIEKAQLHHRLEDYYRIITNAVERSLDIYFETLEGTKEPPPLTRKKQLLKIGELAKATGETVPTLRYWTKEGLLQVAQVSAGGYQLFAPEMAKQVAEIRRLQSEERLTIQEIKKRV